MEKEGVLDDRVKDIIELYRTGVSPDESIRILEAKGWTTIQIFEAIVLMQQRMDKIKKGLSHE